MLNEAMQVKLGQVYDDKTHPPFANEEQWKKQWDKKLNEAGMDKRFEKEWRKNVKVLINHVKHELKQPDAKKQYLKELLRDLEKVENAASRLATVVGYE